MVEDRAFLWLGQARGLSTSQSLGQMLKCFLEPLCPPIVASLLKEELNCLAAAQMPTPTWVELTHWDPSP